MPELPEVEVTRRALLPELVGRRILALYHQDPGRYQNTEAAAGQEILDVRRRGKFILMPLSGGDWLVVHLGMSGGFRWQKTPHTRVVFALDDKEVYFHDPRRFGRIWVVKDPAEVPLLAELGPEPGEAAFTPAYLKERLKKIRRPVKAALLDQRVVAGLGNIYADEALFLAGVRPTRPANELADEEIERLWRAAREVLAEAVAAGGTTLKDKSYRRPDARLGYFQHRLKVYGRENKPCPRCQTPIERVAIQGRSAHFCPRCQR